MINTNRKKLLIAASVVIAVMLSVICLVLFLYPNNTTTADGAISIDYSKEENDDWDKIPESDKLILLLTDQIGGNIGRVVYIKDTKSTVYLRAYLKAELFGDEETAYIFLQYDDGWKEISEKNIPTETIKLLNDKLKSTQKDMP